MRATKFGEVNTPSELDEDMQVFDKLPVRKSYKHGRFHGGDQRLPAQATPVAMAPQQTENRCHLCDSSNFVDSSTTFQSHQCLRIANPQHGLQMASSSTCEQIRAILSLWWMPPVPHATTTSWPTLRTSVAALLSLPSLHHGCYYWACINLSVRSKLQATLARERTEPKLAAAR